MTKVLSISKKPAEESTAAPGSTKDTLHPAPMVLLDCYSFNNLFLAEVSQIYSFKNVCQSVMCSSWK